MSERRTLDSYAKSKGYRPGTCRWCGEEITNPRRRTYCSGACVHEWRIRSDPGYVRQQLWKRDHGICAECGIDTVAEAKREYEERRGHPARWMDSDSSGVRAPWDADHIHPVHRGGGECGLEGFQTLCKPCHKVKSAKEAAARAGAKAATKRVDSGVLLGTLLLILWKAGLL